MANSGLSAGAWRRCLLALAIVSGLLVAGLAIGHRLTILFPDTVKEMLRINYLTLRGAGLERSLSRDPFEALRYSLDFTSPWTGRALLLLACTFVLLLLWYRFRRAKALWQLLLLALIAVDLLGFAGHFHPKMSLDAMQSAGPSGRFLQQRSGFGRVLTLWPDYDTWPDRLLPSRVSYANGYSSLAPHRTDHFLGKAQQGLGQFLGLLNVRYIVTGRGREPAWLRGREPVFSEAGVEIYEWQSHVPRAFVVAQSKVGTAAEVLAGMSDPAFQAERTVWLEEQPESTAAPASSASDGATSAEVMTYADDTVTVRVRTPKPAFLVLADSYYPGWVAYVDDRPQRIYRANYLFRAVALPPGQHTVRFAFEAHSVRLGALISLAAAGSALLLLVLSRRLRPRRPTASGRFSL